ncbi:MAG: hypothetical protein SYC29_13045, partial [Planctomycetota bacterium]|nr:hypothetical protein [Planctomycetota bacterium]
PFFGENDFWSPNCGPFHRNLLVYASECADVTVKYSQPIDCEEGCWFSNLNSNLNPYVRYDDFVCNQTGEITEIVFWASGYDISTFESCSLTSNVEAVEINLYEWVEGGPCEWQPGELLCSNVIPLSDIEAEPECFGPFGEEYFKLTARLPEPCYQVEGRPYALRIAGILVNPDNPCIFCWASTPQVFNCTAYSVDRVTGDCLPGEVDNAFELLTEPGGDCIIDQNQPNAVTYMAAFSQTDLAQSFKQENDTICGAGIQLYTVGDPGEVTISLWDALPNQGGVMLASASDIGTPGNWIDVFWPTVSITAGQTYYLVFEDANTGMGIYGDTSNPYPDGQVFANPGYDPFPDFDYTFRTYYETGVQNTCPWDFDGNGVVNTADLLFLLGAWGTPDGDVNDDGTTNTADLLELLGAWGDCP